MRRPVTLGRRSRRQGRDRRRPRAGPADHRRRLLPAQIRRPALEDGRRLRRLGERPMHTFVAFLLRQRWFVIAATLLLCIAGWVGLDAAADRRVSRRHERPGHGPDRGRRALGGRRRAAGHLPDRAADGRRAAGDPGPLALQGRPLAGDRRLRGRHRHLLRAPAGLRAHPGGEGAAPGRRRSRSWARPAPDSARSSSTRSRARRSRRWSCAGSRTSSWRRSCGRSPA